MYIAEHYKLCVWGYGKKVRKIKDGRLTEDELDLTVNKDNLKKKKLL